MAQDQLRLAAIVSADAAGYFHLMVHAESPTLDALKPHRRELIDPKHVDRATYRVNPAEGI